MPPLTVSATPSARVSPLVGARDVERDVGGERRLAHAGAAGQNDEVGRLQTAHVAIEVQKAGGDSRQRAFALVGLRGHVDRDLQRVGEALEAAVVTPSLGDLIEAPLRLLDLLARARIDRGVVGDVDHVLADRDELAPKREVVDAAPVVVGVDDRGGFGGEPRQILRHRDAAEVMVAEEGLQGDRGGELALPDHRAGDLIDSAMDFLNEVLAAQEVGDAVEGVVVDQDRAEQGLLGFDIGRRNPVGALRRGGRALEYGFEGRHGG